MSRFEYDLPTKIWTVVTGVIFMLLIQWPALFTALLQDPNTRGHMVWNVFASLVGLAAPVAWFVDDLLRRRIGYPWIAVTLAVLTWAIVSISLVNP